MRNKLNIEEQCLDAIEGLLSQSLKGLHFLFDKDDIARVLKTPTEELDLFNEENIPKVQDLFLELIENYSFAEKKSYLDQLDNESYEIVLRAYFHIVDNTASTSFSLRH